MKLISIEPTPSPNSMKLNIDEVLPPGVRQSYSKQEADSAPEPLRSLLQITGVRSVFRTSDFIALDRVSSADWSAILSEARTLLGGTAPDTAAEAAVTTAQYGEARVLVQTFRGIPMQLRVRAGDREVRSALPAQFTDAVSEAAGSSMIRERTLSELGIRYGELEEIAGEVVKELTASYPPERLQELIEAAKSAASPANGDSAAAVIMPRRVPLSADELELRLQSPDWQVRYAALERVTPSPELLPILAGAVRDTHTSVRRLAVVYLGDLKIPEALPYLFAALRDTSASVRRTAGDTLSDLGDPAAIPSMIEALRDRNKLVRWRAARFLYEAGDESALDALRIAAEDSEFEIQLQAQMALERIERGEEAAGSVWQQMTSSRDRTE
ncbi:virulence factor [Paenibacillus sp. GCM10023252]|uniref:conserved virulence factor C family protein n=1 Tax=Paenibacillus sp. GCM10023252 TaxID=3252649 RepID=UPI00360EA804